MEFNVKYMPDSLTRDAFENRCTHLNSKARLPVFIKFAAHRQLIFENLDDGKAVSVSAFLLCFSGTTDPQPSCACTLKA